MTKLAKPNQSKLDQEGEIIFSEVHSPRNPRKIRARGTRSYGRARKYYELTPQAQTCLDTFEMNLAEQSGRFM